MACAQIPFSCDEIPPFFTLPPPVMEGQEFHLERVVNGWPRHYTLVAVWDNGRLDWAGVRALAEDLMQSGMLLLPVMFKHRFTGVRYGK